MGLVINLKTAKALGVEIPPTLLARADEVIEWPALWCIHWRTRSHVPVKSQSGNDPQRAAGMANNQGGASNPTLFRKAFHIKGNDDLPWVTLTDALQVFQTTLQLVSRLLQAALEFRLGPPASLFIREFLEHHGWEEPPFRPVACSGRTD